MSVFEVYAQYYDEAYSDKDYVSEAKFVDHLVQQVEPGAKSILDLGCGTGTHAFRLAEMGYTVHGVDKSLHMIEVAQRRRQQVPIEMQQRVAFTHADIRKACLNARYDVVISLFHVFSYQITDDDVRLSLNTASQHLVPGGLLLFDFWYGPAVLRNPPQTRIKRIESEQFKMVRIAEPRLHPNDNLVDVEFLFFVRERGLELREFGEKHRMRYFFLPELQLFLERAGFTPRHKLEWLTGNEPSTTSWSVYVLAQLAAEMEASRVRDCESPAELPRS
jgi:SAM-dependent methyltransferase